MDTALSLTQFEVTVAVETPVRRGAPGPNPDVVAAMLRRCAEWQKEQEAQQVHALALRMRGTKGRKTRNITECRRQNAEGGMKKAARSRKVVKP